MAFTQQQLDALEESIAGGELTVQYETKRVTYRTLAEMRSLRQEMRKELGLSDTTPRRANPRHTKGL